MTAGVVALGLNGFYHDGGAEWVGQVADRVTERSAALVERVSTNADELLAEARMVAVRDQTAPCRLSTALAHVQTKIAQTKIAQTRIARSQAGFAHFQAMSARQEAQMARLEADQVEVENQVEARVRARINAQLARARFVSVAFDPVKVRVACPRLRANVPAVRIPAVSIPEVNIPEANIPRVNLPRLRMATPVIIDAIDADSDTGPI